VSKKTKTLPPRSAEAATQRRVNGSAKQIINPCSPCEIGAAGISLGKSVKSVVKNLKKAGKIIAKSAFSV